LAFKVGDRVRFEMPLTGHGTTRIPNGTYGTVVKVDSVNACEVQFDNQHRIVVLNDLLTLIDSPPGTT
jgi:hypothetical protein